MLFFMLKSVRVVDYAVEQMMDDSSFRFTDMYMYSSDTLLSSGRSIVSAHQSRQSVNHPI
jgi:hypothetical protein